MTIKLQLDMLWKLIELTDPIFAQYLGKCNWGKVVNFH